MSTPRDPYICCYVLYGGLIIQYDLFDTSAVKKATLHHFQGQHPFHITAANSAIQSLGIRSY